MTITQQVYTEPPITVGHRRAATIALGLWAGLIVVAFGWGAVLLSHDALHLDAFPPLHGHLRLQTWQLIPALVAGVGVILALPAATARLSWRPLLLAAWLATLGWTVALALSDGVSQLAAPFAARNEYLPVLPAMGDRPLSWLRSFTGELLAYPTHVKGHPPLPDLILWALDRVGARGPGPAAALAIAVGASAVVAVAVTVRSVAGEELARRALPYLVLGPWAISVATSMDALFLGVAAWGTALLALASHRTAQQGMAPASLAGVLLGSLPYLSYGLVPFAAIPFVVLLVARPATRVLIGAVLGAVSVAALFAAGGFWWPDGVSATRIAWELDAGALRPYTFFLIGNLAVLGLITGPAVAAAVPRIRSLPRPVALLGAAALLGMIVLDLSGYTRGEVQRIWIPYAVWFVPVAAALPKGRTRAWLAAQVGVGLLLQATLQAPW
ncbi:hypothetical protein N5079_33440 [Planotetraspora sp. A-T 1434]|uniref:hypothetical protein n=1 Tax=Planotetraspora sp. A-T 1434 TaxID=2979219 RepID=UPI0021C1A272|nr:hypothetical protein [Planotetraspora sp. A-T 1434]MCT9935117.1 hypothetical protein [Planotetraspora sp. A-T 1434]